MVNSNNQCPDGFLYTIVIGDTFYSIAQDYNISVQSLINANPEIKPDKLQIGQQICIPAEVPDESACPGTLYAVQPGDTLVEIAKNFGYTLDALISVNQGIDPNNISVGKQICLPPSPGGGPFPCFGGSIYRIKAGDTFYSIASRFDVPLNELIEANQHTDPDNLTVGEPICIPR